MLKYYLCLYLLLYLVQTFAQNSLIAAHGFEQTGDTWPIEVISTPPCTQQGDTWNYHTILENILPIEGNYFWGIQDLNGNCGSSDFEYIEFTSFNIADFRKVILSFNVMVQGYDNGDDMKYELWLDGESQGEVLFIDGQNDLSYDQWTTVSIDIPNVTSWIKFRISIKQNGSDIAGLDNFRLEGEPISPCSELMISEYLEGGSSTSHRNNYIELYNPSDQSLDLRVYELVKYTGKNIQPSSRLQLTGSLEPWASFLIKDNTENLSISADLSTNSAVMDYNGDDKIALHKNEQIIDVVGQIGDSVNFGKDVTLRRKSQIKNPNNEFNFEEWDRYGIEDIADLGVHASYCQGNLPEIELYGKGADIFDGSASTSLINNTYFSAWPVVKDTLIQRSFIIKNTGNKNLDVDQILISGSGADQFSTDFDGIKSVPPNGNIQFTVDYKPNLNGIHTARLEIINSDPSENPFEFAIQGEGTGPSSHPLIISQYYEGNANNKWIEITNISNKTTPENTYYLALFRNEDTQHPIGIKPSSKKLIPAIASGQSIKYSASLNVTAPAYAIDGTEIKTAVCNFTGDDMLVISTSDSESCWAERTDIIGNSGNWGANLSMVRKYGCDAAEANTGFQESDWLIFSNDTIDLAAQDSNLSIGVHNSGATSWRAGSWTNGKPDARRKAIIESDYSTDIHGDLISCNMHLLKDANLFVKDSNHITIQKDLLVEGSLDVSSEGSLVLVDDHGIIENPGSILIHKTTTELKPYDYTYWSSPVQNAQLESVFWNSPKTSFYFFSTKDFEDLDNDGLDDNDNAWVRASGTMQVGRGYTSMAPDPAPINKMQQVTFNGSVNNGIIEIPVYATAESIPRQQHWNLIGNPYPSAIDAQLLLNHPENTGLLSGTFYFWTHSTPLAIEDSNGLRRYTSDDYAIYTVGTGGVKANPDGKEPTQFISSCQGFFVEALKEGLLIFNNGMRTNTHNDHFFKSNKSKNTVKEKKIWLNLTNNEGAFSQILIGFIDGATNLFDVNFDGLRIDAQNPVNFYSLSDEKPYAIQGLPEFQGDEKIQLGLHSRILEETLLNISLDHIKGDFADTDIILHDKLLNKNHNLLVSPYSFVLAEPSRVNQRFELHFGPGQHLNPTTSVKPSKITWQLIDEMLLVSTNNNDTIKRLEIFDLNGRKLKDHQGQSNSVKINWSGFPSRAIYILRVKLKSSRIIVTKIIP
jgi:hypothetical protein